MLCSGWLCIRWMTSTNCVCCRPESLWEIFLAHAPPHKITPGYQYWTRVRGDQPKKYSEHSIEQPTNQGGQIWKAKYVSHVRLKDEHWDQLRKESINWKEETRLRREETFRTWRPSYEDMLHCLMVCLRTPTRQDRSRRAHPSPIPGGIFVMPTRTSTRAQVYKKKRKAEWKKVCTYEKQQSKWKLEIASP